MTDLNYTIAGKTPGQLARYFDCPVEIVRDAISNGAKTYQDVYDYIQRNKK